MTHTMNMTYRSKKQITKLMTNSSQLLTILMSKLGNSLEAAWEQAGTSRNLVPHEITSRPSRDYVSSLTTFLRPFSSKRAELERRLVMSMLLMLMVGVNGAWGQEPVEITTDANEDGNIDDTEKKLYLIQTSQFQSFYIAPQNNNITTNNILGDYMLWYFLDAGTYDDIQYYYIVNNRTGNNYIYNNSGRTIQLTNFASLSDENKEKCKFKIVLNETNGTTGFYNINIKGRSGTDYYGLNKQNGSETNSNNPIRLTNDAYINDVNSKWKFIPFNGTFAWPTPPFTPSTDLDKHYYKIRNIKDNTYYVSTDAMPDKVTYASTESDRMIWYLKEAPSDSWFKYYYIINPSTGGRYMYYNGTATNGNNQNNAVSVKEYNSENEDRYKFVVVRTAKGDWPIGNTDGRVECYAIIPKLLTDKLWGSNSIGLGSISDGANMGIISSRGANNTAQWIFEVTDYSTECATPTITFSNTTGKVTITTTTSNPSIYYTTNGTEPSSTNGTLYVGPFDVTEETTIKAIVTRDGFTDSEVTTETFYQVATPTIQNNGSNAVSITSATEGATIYYTTDDSNPTTTSSTEYTAPLTENISGVTIRAIAVKDGMINSAIGSGSVTLSCATPVFTRNENNLTISCPFPATGVSIYYTKNGGEPTTSSTLYTGAISVDIDDVIKAIAVAEGYNNSEVATKTVYDELQPIDGKYYINNQTDFEKFVDMANSTEGASHHYILKTNVDAGSPITVPFTGVFEVAADENGNFYTISGLTHPLFNTIDGGVVKNAIFSGVDVKGNGTICNEASGATKIYNCGVLSGTVTGSGNVGGLVGHITSSSSVRVINCYNFAKVIGGSTMGGIVGNNEGTVGAVRIAMCMMYGDMPGGTSPVYAGNHTSNASNFTEYNYWRSKANLSFTTYNDQLAIDNDEYLTRFPFYRHILNTHRELAAYFLFAENTTTGSVSDITAAQVEEIGHWSIDKSKAIYPIIEKWEKNTKKVLNAPSGTTVSVRKGNGTPITSLKVKVIIGANTYTTFPGTETELTLPITDMDEENHDYTWGKVVLPFANEFEVNTDYSKICTGWKITGITGGNGATYSNYNMSDRECTAKDLYSNTGFIFAQGGYYIVPYNVTKIEITANFANAFYLSDESYDISYSGDNTTAGYKDRTGLGGSTQKKYHDKPVYNTLAAALGAIETAVGSNSPTGTTHEQAVVLVGNYHQDEGTLKTANGYTIMSIDADNNQEPDYAIYSNYTADRPQIPPTRFDFVAMIPVGMSAHVTNSKFYPNIPIFKSHGWFELTETSLLRADQFELDSKYFDTSNSDKKNYRCIINGGYFTQMVRSNHGACTNVSYFQIGGKAYVKEFYPGNHSAKSHANKLVPINVTGGEIEQCFMTGYGKGTAYGPDIYFWCAGGKIGKFLGAYMEKPRQSTSADGNVNLTAKIDHAIIGRFFGGGTSPSACVTGNINVTIDNSRVDFYCGGPEFGNMTDGKTVKTEATNTYFKEYYGAGFGGTGITYTNDKDTGEDLKNKNTFSYPGYFNECYVAAGKTDIGRLRYKSNYGIGSCYKFEFVMHSRGNQAVSRFFTGYARFSLASTGNVTNILNGCEIENDFYGAGCQGKVNGTVTSTLTGCTVHGSAFGGGFKAESNQVDVYPANSPSLSTYTSETCLFTGFGTIAPETYEWVQGTSANKNTVDDSNKKLYTGTDVTLTDLGNVTGAISLTIDGGSVTENVYGGGNESKSLNNTTVVIQNGAQITGNVYGGGNLANVEGNTSVNITGGTITENVFGGGKGEADEFSCSKAMIGVNNAGAGADLTTDENKNKGTKVTISNGQVNGNVYGGGEVGRVEWNTQVTIGAGEGTPIINGSVFGAGAGVATHGYAALVRGNSTVTVQGNAKVLQNVYGGGEQATVGRYWVKGVNDNVTGAPTAPTDTPDEMPYQTMSGGKCTVVVQGSAQVGPDSNVPITAGHVFGAGKGVTPNYVHTGDKANWCKRMVDYNATKHTGEPGTTWDYYPDNHAYVWEYFTTEAKYLEFLQTLALVTGTDVTIGGTAKVKGSVFGGSESGYVQDDTDVKVNGGTIGTTDNGGAYYGNVYGGGKGDAEHTGANQNYVAAGLVKGNTKVTISNGTILHNVYGGGAYGSVGQFTYDATGMPTGRVENTTGGKAEVIITGGTFGTTGAENGMIFGSSRGDVGAPGAIHDKLAWVYDTEVKIGQANDETAGPQINGSVYGGGENGHVFNNAAVNIYSGTVGIPTGQEIDNQSGASYPYRGNVYGSGCGTDKYYLNPTEVEDPTDGNGDEYNPLAGIVQGNATVTISGGHVVRNVYGAGAMGSVGTASDATSGKTTVTVRGGRIGYDGNSNNDGNIFGAARGDLAATGDNLAQVRETEVNISYETTPTADNEDKNVQLIAGSVFGGGEAGKVKGSVAVKMTGGLVLKDVYGGGALAHTQTSNWDATANNNAGGWANETLKSALYTTTVRLTGGTILGEAYGGALGQKNGVNGATSDIAAYVYGDVLLDLNGTTSSGETGAAIDNTATGCVVGQIFGCNNINGSPKGDVMVHVYATQNKQTNTIAQRFILEKDCNTEKGGSESDAAYVARLQGILSGKIALAEALSITVSQANKDLCTAQNPTVTDLTTAISGITTSINAKTTEEINAVRYDVEAVYGGGNMAAYVPVTPNTSTTSEANGSRTQVIIEGCEKTSIETVYGGGNAAAVPETNVVIKGAYEIGYLFGGGNGKDKIRINNVLTDNPGADIGQYHNGTEMVTYGTGNANSRMEAGLIHEAYGGSNTKGVLKGSINQESAPKDSDDPSYCCELVLEKIVGAGKYADIDGDVNMTLSCQPSSKVPLLFAGADEANVNGNITLNITNGNFGKVFGGNNLGGAVKGKITVNVEETGCQPIKIDELYLGGNEAAYSIYGYYESGETQTATGKKILKPRTSATDSRLPVKPDGTEYASISDFINYAQPELNIISCTYIGEVFGGGYGEGAVMYANPTVNVNLVPGLYADGVPEMMNSLGLSADAYANPNNVGIIRNVYGGGNAANVAGDTYVNIATKYLVKEVNVGDDVSSLYTRDTNESYTKASGTAQANVTYYEKSSAYIIGSVFGGGNAADVLGNTNVTMSDGYVFNGIFGGGYAGNVGTFTERSYTEKTYAGNIEFDHSTHNDCIGKPTKCKAGTGKCTVLVNGGQIGPYTVATLGMNRKDAEDHGDPVPEGWVWGAGQGLIEDPAKEPDTHFKSYVGSTDVTIGGTAFVLESIIGGGEFGRVLGDTKVTITGNCQIGVGAGKVDANNKPIRYTDAQFVNPLTTTITGGENGNALAECSHFPYGEDTNDDGIKDRFLPYDPYYDEFKNTTYITQDHPDLSLASSSSPTDGKTWIGCVFAGGSGYMPYLKKDNNGNNVGYDWCSSAGLVEGNTNLTISGGHILTNVYGGNEYTNVKGKCKVTMTGGTIGVPRTIQQIIDHPLTCYLFGAGKGDPRPHFNTETNVGEVEVEILGGTIYGSVFGGGEDGHVERNVKMTIGNDDHTGPVIGTWGTTYVDGNIFGGGRGFAGDAYTAGNVAGSVDLDIKGGNILGSIYGGGRLGSVGYGLYPPSAGETYYGAMRPDNTGDDANNTAIANFKRGYVDVEISGGTIGNRYEYIIPSAANTPNGLTFADIASWTDANWKTWKTHNNIPLTEFDKETYRLKHTKGGNVFAGGMGRLYQLDGITPISAVNWWKVGCVKQTKLTVKGGTIKSNVYGGGELGAVKPYVGNTVEGGNTEVIVQNENTTQIGTEIKDGSSVTQYTFGSVYGGGYGSTIEKLNVTDDPNTENDNPKFVAGLVHGDTKIVMQAGKVLASVYGGGEVASVNGSADVAVSGGEVGKDKVGDKQFGGPTMGNVYGGGSGHPNIVRCGRILKNTKVTISGTNTGTKIYHNVYGGGAYGTVGDFEYTTGNDGKVTGILKRRENTTGGKAEVIITGGTIGTDGHENGMIFGSSRGDVNEPGARDDHTAWVYDAKVTIGTAGQGTTYTTPLVKGSVYGSGENGHTFNDAIVNIYSGTVGITDPNIDGGARYTFRGNVYGGGCGTDIYTKDNKRRYNPLAGIVYGTTTVNMTGGHVVHDVFGGGAMGSVGKFTFNDKGKPTGIVQGAATNSGKCTLNISGGMIGMTDMQMTATGGPDDYGHVFGAGRGEVKDTTLYDNLNVTGYVNSTEVNISGTAFVTGSVYGGAESGHVLGNTSVQVSGGQIGCGVGKTAAYTPDEWAAASPSTLAPCASWTYTANGNGAPYDPNAGDYNSEGGATTATDGHTFYGNVFGGGSGYYQYSPGIWIRSAGRVEGNTSVVISGGHILSNVYGGNECTDVFGSATISMTDGTVGVPRTQTQIESNPVLGHIYGAGKGDKRVLFNTWTNVASTSVSLTGGKVYGSVYGGGEDGHVLGNAVTTINGADLVIGCDGTSGYDGNVFGGGQGSSTALTAGVVGGNVTLNIQDGTMKGSVYGGGRLAAVGTFFETPNDDNYGKLHSDNPTLHGNISVNLTGGKIYQDVFGGGMGVTNVDNADRFAISRNVTVHLNENVATTAKGCIVKGRIFGANNANASPKGDVLVHIHATQNEGTADIKTKVTSGYDVDYVFGGGNNADYVPTETGAKQSTEVIIEGCDLTSIEEVYGGGYGAATPGTKVEIRGTKIIDNVFGGGYGAGQNNPGANVGIKTDGTTEYGLNTDDNKYKTAVVRLMAGNVNNVYGGSNTKGDIRGGSSITNIDKTGSQGTNQPCCDNLNVNNIYGGGKDAEMAGGAEIVLGCMPNDWVAEIYAGAENADVGNDVSLTLTSGKFGRVFGGNKSGGRLHGGIIVNIEENGDCGTPIIIGELYGGGNEAPYSIYGYKNEQDANGKWIPREKADFDAMTAEEKAAEGMASGHHHEPQVNVRAFTSIGNIYGGGYGSTAVMVGNPSVNINEVQVVTDKELTQAQIDADTSKPAFIDGTTVRLYPHESGKMGVIGNVFGGGNAAKIIGNTTVNVATKATETFDSVADDPSTTADERVKTVVGADIRGNVYGGGNNAEVTGNTNVTIGKRVE